MRKKRKWERRMIAKEGNEKQERRDSEGEIRKEGRKSGIRHG